MREVQFDPHKASSSILHNQLRIAATLLCARKLMELDSDRPSLPQTARDESLSSNGRPRPAIS
jgi:hypothetical protein